jgi:hypothetical protein
MAITKQGYESDDSIEEQIRSAAEKSSAGKAAPTIKMDEEAPTKMPMRPGQASSGSKTPMVTKEQLAASGLSLRDYLNKQQGLTRRGESTRMPAMSNKLGQPGGSISDAGSGRDVAAKQSDKADLTSPMSALRSLTRGKRREDDDRPVNERIRSAMGMAKGGSVGSASKRADGIAVRGKTKGKMC